MKLGLISDVHGEIAAYRHAIEAGGRVEVRPSTD